MCTNVPALSTKQITHECNIEKHEKIEKALLPGETAFFPSVLNAHFLVEPPLFFEGHKPLPWENQSNLCTTFFFLKRLKFPETTKIIALSRNAPKKADHEDVGIYIYMYKFSYLFI